MHHFKSVQKTAPLFKSGWADGSLLWGTQLELQRGPRRPVKPIFVFYKKHILYIIFNDKIHKPNQKNCHKCDTRLCFQRRQTINVPYKLDTKESYHLWKYAIDFYLANFAKSIVKWFLLWFSLKIKTEGKKFFMQSLMGLWPVCQDLTCTLVQQPKTTNILLLLNF